MRGKFLSPSEDGNYLKNIFFFFNRRELKNPEKRCAKSEENKESRVFHCSRSFLSFFLSYFAFLSVRPRIHRLQSLQTGKNTYKRSALAVKLNCIKRGPCSEIQGTVESPLRYYYSQVNSDLVQQYLFFRSNSRSL